MIQAGTISTGSAPTVGGRRRVLDQLDQRVAEHDLAGRGGEVVADREAAGGAPPASPPDRAASCCMPCREIAAAGGAGGLDHLGIEPGHVGRRYQIEPLPHREGDDALDCADRLRPGLRTTLSHHSSPSSTAWVSRS